MITASHSQLTAQYNVSRNGVLEYLTPEALAAQTSVQAPTTPYRDRAGTEAMVTQGCNLYAGRV